MMWIVRSATEGTHPGRSERTAMTTLREIETERPPAPKHGMAGAGAVLMEDEDKAVRLRFEQWAGDFRPATGYQTWLVELIAVLSFRVDRCQKDERALRGH